MISDAGASPARARVPDSGVNIVLWTCATRSRSARRCVTTAASRNSSNISTATRRRWCLPDHGSAEMNDIGVEAALWWNDSYHENVAVLHQQLPQRDSGTHLAGFRGALTRQVNGYAERTRRKKKSHSPATLPRRPHRRAFGKGAGSEILSRNQGQAGVLGSPPRGRERPQRGTRGVVRGASGRSKVIVGKVIQAAAAREPPARRAN